MILENGMPIILFVDLQDSLIDTSRTQAAIDIRRSVHALVTIGTALQMPCYAAKIPGPGGAVLPLIAELGQAGEKVTQLERKTISAWSDTFPAVGRVIICGVAMEGAILHTALAARRHGLVVEVPVDACGGLSERTESAAIRQMEAQGVVTTSVASIGTALLGSSTTSSMAIMSALHSLIV